MRLILALLAALALAPLCAAAAEIVVPDGDADGMPVILIRGEILSGDADRFEEAIAGIDKGIVFLTSEGGLVVEALRIGNSIRAKGFVTAVGADDECVSACALIWAAGTPRFMSPTARIGAHAAYRSEGDGQVTSGVANAEIGAYLARLGLGDAAVRFFTIAEPTTMLELTPDLARVVGIDLRLLGSDDTTLPEETTSAPVVPDATATQARYFAGYIMLSSFCDPYLQPDQRIVGNELVRLGTVSFPMPGWEAANEAATDAVARSVEGRGLLTTCLDTEDAIRQGGLITGLDGPSFACAAGATATERALCTSPALWPLDRAMSALYLHARTSSDAAGRQRILSEQRDWLARRDACGADGACLDRTYRDRLRDFQHVILER
jgi:hypothetical protein